MKLNICKKTLGALALATFVSAGLSSCSNEVDEPIYGNTQGNMLVSDPKVVAYSGNHFWTGNGLTRSGDTPRYSEEEVVKFAYAEAPIDREAEAKKNRCFPSGTECEPL